MKRFTEDIYTNLSSIFAPNRKNPNGARISSTLYVTDHLTDYCAVRKLYEDGHELASHGLEYMAYQDLWRQANETVWMEQMAGQKRRIADELEIDISEIRGMRAPYFQPAGNVTFRVMANAGFEYDSTAIYYGNDKTWPITLDFKPWFDICGVWPPPNECYPGLWEVPNKVLQGDSSTGCVFIHACESFNATYALLNKTFYSHFNDPIKPPLSINLDTFWLLTNPFLVDALTQLIDDLLQLDDVYIVNTWQAIQWMKNPTALQNITDELFPEWAPVTRSTKACDFISQQGDRQPKANGQGEGESGTAESAESEGGFSGGGLLAFEIIVLVVTALILIARDSDE